MKVSLLFALTLVASAGARVRKKVLRNVARCPLRLAPCLDPCTSFEDGYDKPKPMCQEGEQCLTRPEYFKNRGLECPGCPIFDRCEKVEPAETILPCPMMRCMDPCMDYSNGYENVKPMCGDHQKCLTKPDYFEMDGQKCPSCSVFDKCEDTKPIVVCPMVACFADPCSFQDCPDGTVCLTKQSYYKEGDLECPSCPIFDRCEKVEPPIEPYPLPYPCPMVMCIDPCTQYDDNWEISKPMCPEGQECITKPTYFDGGNDQKCAGCGAFDRCEEPAK